MNNDERKPTIGSLAPNSIGHALRALYAPSLREPLPEEFLDADENGRSERKRRPSRLKVGMFQVPCRR